MSWAYFDTSALIKRYIDEPGTRQVLPLLRRHACITSSVLPVEVRSALRRRISERSIGESAVQAILKRLATDREFWTFVEVSTDVLSVAETLVAVHPLRALDAVHVASAQVIASRLRESDVLFVSADERQTTAATAIGLTTRLIGPSTSRGG